MEGPHGLAVSRDGRFLHVTTGHGLPDDAHVGSVDVGQQAWGIAFWRMEEPGGGG